MSIPSRALHPIPSRSRSHPAPDPIRGRCAGLDEEPARLLSHLQLLTAALHHLLLWNSVTPQLGKVTASGLNLAAACTAHSHGPHNFHDAIASTTP